jgi:hypothetical protein
MSVTAHLPGAAATASSDRIYVRNAIDHAPMVLPAAVVALVRPCAAGSRNRAGGPTLPTACGRCPLMLRLRSGEASLAAPASFETEPSSACISCNYLKSTRLP